MINPLISIITPVYNAAVFLDKLVNSVISQTFNSWELILINDGSIDTTEEVIFSFLEIDKRIKYFKQENKGPSAARNLGIQKASGTYLTFIDADDFVRADYLEQLINSIQDDGSIDLVCAGYFEKNIFQPQGIALHDFQHLKDHKAITVDVFTQNIFKGLTGVLWAKLFKTEIIRENQILMPENIKFSEDLIFVMRYARQARNVALVFDNIYYYNRLNDEGITRKLDKSFINNILDFNALVLEERVLEKIGLQEQLNKRTAHLLMKMLKDQAVDSKNLKNYHQLINQNFDDSILQISLSKMDKVFIKLIQKKYYVLAKWQMQIINYLRK